MKFSRYALVSLFAAAVAAFECDPTVLKVNDADLNSIKIELFGFICNEKWTRLENLRFVLRQGENEYPGTSISYPPATGTGNRYFFWPDAQTWGPGLVGTHAGLNVCVVYSAFDEENNKFDEIKCVMGPTSWEANGETIICPDCERSDGN